MKEKQVCTDNDATQLGAILMEFGRFMIFPQISQSFSAQNTYHWTDRSDPLLEMQTLKVTSAQVTPFHTTRALLQYCYSCKLEKWRRTHDCEGHDCKKGRAPKALVLFFVIQNSVVALIFLFFNLYPSRADLRPLVRIWVASGSG